MDLAALGVRSDGAAERKGLGCLREALSARVAWRGGGGRLLGEWHWGHPELPASQT